MRPDDTGRIRAPVGTSVKSRGWQGDQPTDDADARRRIIAAAMRCIDRHGPFKTGMSDVAAELGVTRQTIYRLYPSTEDLLVAVAAAGADTFVDRLVARVRGETDPAEMLVECLAFTLERLAKERYLSLLVVPDRQAAFTRESPHRRGSSSPIRCCPGCLSTGRSWASAAPSVKS
jgi:AcrR family transcriptional regulator